MGYIWVIGKGAGHGIRRLWVTVWVIGKGAGHGIRRLWVTYGSFNSLVKALDMASGDCGLQYGSLVKVLDMASGDCELHMGH